MNRGSSMKQRVASKLDIFSIISRMVHTRSTSRSHELPAPSICMKTIRTAAYAAVAATTSNGLLLVATDIIEMKAQIKPVMTPNLTLLADVNSNHHMGASSITSPIKMMLAVVKRSNFSSLEYTVVLDSTWWPGTGCALNIFQSWKL
jgi:hypothetical protein